MKKLIKYIFPPLLALILIGCAASHKKVERINDEQARTKARDHFLKGLFYQSDEAYDKALVEFYEALHYDSTSAEIYNSIAENHLKMGHFKSAHLLLNKAITLDPENKEALTLLADSYFKLHRDEEAIGAYKNLLKVDPYNEQARKILMFLYKKTNNDSGIAQQYEEFIRIYGLDKSTLNELIRVYTRNRDYQKAIKLSNELLQMDSTRSDIYYRMGDLYEKLNLTDSAMVYYRKSINEKTDFLPSYERIALIYRRQQKWQEIIDLFMPLLGSEKTETPARVMIAESQYNLERFEEARNTLEPVLEKTDAGWSIFELIGRIDLELENYDSAENYFREIVEKDSTNRTAWLFLGFTFADREDYEQAEKVYWKALKHLPADPVLLTFYGQTLHQLGRVEEAQTYLERSLEYNPYYRHAVEKLSVIYRQKGEWQKIINVYEPFYQRDSADVAANMFIAEGEFYLEKYDRVEERLNKLLDLDNTPIGAYELFGRVEMVKERYDQARIYFNKILEINRQNRFAWLLLGFSYSDQTNYEMAAEVLMQGLVELPEDAGLWAFYGIAMQNMDKLEDAIYPLEQALRYDPNHLNALTTLPIIYESLKYFEKSDSLYEVGLSRHPDNALLLNNYSYSLSERGKDLDRALEMVQNALQVQPDNSAYLDTIGWIYFKLGNYQEAEKHIKMAIELQEASPVVLEHLGDVYFKMNNLESAKLHWQRSLDLEPDNESLKKKMEDI